MKQFFAYIRVSTVKQGEKGVSLQEQKDAIASYAHRNGSEITQWFEEQETAAKHGRPVFTQMLRLLRIQNGLFVTEIQYAPTPCNNVLRWL
jgi:DNA invertase Pin-like site-specific DNA recombinase